MSQWQGTAVLTVLASVGYFVYVCKSIYFPKIQVGTICFIYDSQVKTKDITRSSVLGELVYSVQQ